VDVPDLTGWEAYCNECGCFRETRRADERGARDASEYHEFVCNTCHSILLTFQPLGTQADEQKPQSSGVTAQCPHCLGMNVFPGFYRDVRIRLPALRSER
jgi:hypothetical protein